MHLLSFLGVLKNMLITRNDPRAHPMLNQILNLANKSKLNYEVSKKLGFYITKFYDLNNSFHKMKMIVVDDPLAAVFAMFSSFNSYKICFWSFEQAEYQLKIKNIYTFVRFLLFRVSYLLAFPLSNEVIFPSKLRKDLAIRKYFFFKNISKKSKILYNVRINLLNDYQQRKKNSLNTLQKQKNLAIYAGAIQEGRLIDNILEDAKKKKYQLKICGAISGNYKAKFLNIIESYPNTIYLGILGSDDLKELYKSASFGYVSYLNNPLNSKYCAPVKIFEYSYYDLKILSNANFSIINEWFLFVDDFYGPERFKKKVNFNTERKKFIDSAILDLENNIYNLFHVR